MNLMWHASQTSANEWSIPVTPPSSDGNDRDAIVGAREGGSGVKSEPTESENQTAGEDEHDIVGSNAKSTDLQWSVLVAGLRPSIKYCVRLLKMKWTLRNAL